MGKMKMVRFSGIKLLWVSPMRLTTHYHHTRYEENGSEGKFSLRMPRRKSSVFKLPVLIQFQVTADTSISLCLVCLPNASIYCLPMTLVRCFSPLLRA